MLVALAATDSESHMAVIQTLAELFMSEEAINDLVNAPDEKQIYEYLIEFDKRTQENN